MIENQNQQKQVKQINEKEISLWLKSPPDNADNNPQVDVKKEKDFSLGNSLGTRSKTGEEN